MRAAYAALDQEIGLGQGGESAPPGDDREPFDAEAVYQEGLSVAVSFGGFADGLALPAYDQCVKASHLFNLLDARGVISVADPRPQSARPVVPPPPPPPRP